MNTFNAAVRLVSHGECDMADEVCEICEHRTCVANIYVTSEGDTDLVYTCDSITCINRAINDNHDGDNSPIVEVHGPSKPVLVDEDGNAIICAA